MNSYSMPNEQLQYCPMNSYSMPNEHYSMAGSSQGKFSFFSKIQPQYPSIIYYYLCILANTSALYRSCCSTIDSPTAKTIRITAVRNQGEINRASIFFKKENVISLVLHLNLKHKMYHTYGNPSWGCCEESYSHSKI